MSFSNRMNPCGSKKRNPECSCNCLYRFESISQNIGLASTPSESDTVGLGDILSAAFCSTMIKENDPLWAFCFACGAVQAARDSGKTGLEKIPNRGQTVTNASYFYNTVDFRQV